MSKTLIGKAAALGVATGAIAGFGIIPSASAFVPRPAGTPDLPSGQLEYLIEGNFGQNTGPNQKGYWRVRTYWDPAAQRWTFWDVFMYSAGFYGPSNDPRFVDGNLIERLSSLEFAGDGIGTPIPNLFTSPSSAYVPLTGSIDTTSGCFGSPNQKGNSIPNGSTYYESGVYTGGAGSTYCNGRGGDPAYLTSPSSGGGQTASIDGTFAVVQDEIHILFNGTNQNTVSHSFFRIPLLLTDPTLASGVAGSLANPWKLTGTNTQSQEWFGWSVTTFEVTGNPGINSNITGSCDGGNGFPTTLGTCPYAGNQQNNQGLAGTASLTVNNGVPAPLPAAGVIPLGYALRRMSGRRRQLIAGSLAAKP